MTIKDNAFDDAAKLRIRAEEIARNKTAQITEIMETVSCEETRRMLHELRVHQIELEMQNEELRNIQRELIASKERYFDLYNLAPVGYCTVSENWLILNANLTIASMLSADRSVLIKQPLSRYILPDDQDIFYLHRKQLFETGEPQTYDMRMVKNDGTIFWAHLAETAAQDSDGAPVRRIVITDITDRKRTEELLRERNDELAAILDAIPALVWTSLDPECRIITGNRYVNELFGVSAGANVSQTAAKNGQAVYIKHLKADGSEYRADELPMQQAVARGVTIPDQELEYVLPDGRHLFVMGNAVPLFDDKKQVRGSVCVFIDITERKRAEAEKVELEAQNRQLQKVESLGRMAGAIAHHFNNQLCAVMGNLEIAMDHLPRGADISETLAEAQKAAIKAADVSRLMLTYLGQTPGKHEPIDLSETCHQNLTLLQAAAPRGIIINAEFPSSGPVIRADTNQMHQILTNLVTNAWESISDSSGTIRLTVKTVSHVDIPASNRFPIDWQPKESNYACLEVSDTGCGIADKCIEKLFDPFFTTKFTGRGLGLPVVMGIVKAHGGGVTVESEPVRGSVFRVFLQVLTEEFPIQHDLPVISVALQAGKAENISKIEGGGIMLLIDDDQQVRRMAKIMLTRLGYQVIEAQDGVEALELFQQHQDKIHCVLSDLTMPRMNGWETLDALRKLSPDIPVVLSSGYDEAQVMTGNHAEQPNAFIGKPYQLKTLRETINRVLADQ